jgi:cytochrome c biogenesis protein CcmG/thiol:disulfide interchange protein DsbE
MTQNNLSTSSKTTTQPKLLLKYLPVLFIALILVIFSQGNTNSIKTNFLSDNHIGELIYPSIDSSSNINTTNLIGTRYVLQFLATWCGYCLREHAAILEMKEKLPIYAIGWKDNSDNLKELLKHGNPYINVGIDPSGSISKKLGIKVIPQTFIVNEKGQIIFHKVGQFDPHEMLKYFKK